MVVTPAVPPVADSRGVIAAPPGIAGVGNAGLIVRIPVPVGGNVLASKLLRNATIASMTLSLF